MAWPYSDGSVMGGYQFNPQLDTSSLGTTSSLLNFSQPVASSVGGNVGAGTATGPASLFSALGDYWKGDGFFGQKSMFGGTDTTTGATTKGWAPTALGIGQAIMGGIQGKQAMKLAQDQFKESKRQFDLNYNAQRQSINTDLEDRQRARVASNSGAYQSVSDYMNNNRIN